jgi:2-oxo-hept-3-ene-1,7-dioate hydratase
MFSPELIAQLAAELDHSEKSRVQLEHFSKRFPGMTVEDGYAVSRAWVKLKIAQGRVARGHKIGLTSRAMQQASQIDEPDFGTLLDDMFFEPGDIPTERFIAPRVEVELAFVLKRPLQGEASVAQVLDATQYVTPAIEIIDARIEQFDRHTKAMRRCRTRSATTPPTRASCWAGAKWTPTN